MEIVLTNYQTIGAKAFINQFPANDGTYIYKSLSHKLIIKNGTLPDDFFKALIMRCFCFNYLWQFFYLIIAFAS